MGKFDFDVKKAMAGCPVVNRNGVHVQIVDFCVRGTDRPLLGKVVYSTHEEVRQWKADGTFSDEPNGDDLFLADDDPKWAKAAKAFSGGKECKRPLTPFETAVAAVMVSSYMYDRMRDPSSMPTYVADKSNVVATAASLFDAAKSEMSGGDSCTNVMPELGDGIAVYAGDLCSRLEDIPSDAEIVCAGGKTPHVMYDCVTNKMVIF